MEIVLLCPVMFHVYMIIVILMSLLLCFMQGVQQDHWAMHFDSFKKQNPVSQNTVTFQQFESPQATADPVEGSPASPSASHRQPEQLETMKSTEEEHFPKTGWVC